MERRCPPSLGCVDVGGAGLALDEKREGVNSGSKWNQQLAMLFPPACPPCPCSLVDFSMVCYGFDKEQALGQFPCWCQVRGCDLGFFLAEVPSLDHSYLLPTELHPFAGSTSSSLDTAPRLPCVFRPGCDSGPVFICTYEPGVVGWELEMITSDLGGLTHMGPRFTYEAPLWLQLSS